MPVVSAMTGCLAHYLLLAFCLFLQGTGKGKWGRTLPFLVPWFLFFHLKVAQASHSPGCQQGPDYPLQVNLSMEDGTLMANIEVHFAQPVDGKDVSLRMTWGERKPLDIEAEDNTLSGKCETGNCFKWKVVVFCPCGTEVEVTVRGQTVYEHVIELTDEVREMLLGDPEWNPQKPDEVGLIKSDPYTKYSQDSDKQHINIQNHQEFVIAHGCCADTYECYALGRAGPQRKMTRMNGTMAGNICTLKTTAALNYNVIAHSIFGEKRSDRSPPLRISPRLVGTDDNLQKGLDLQNQNDQDQRRMSRERCMSVKSCKGFICKVRGVDTCFKNTTLCDQHAVCDPGKDTQGIAQDEFDCCEKYKEKGLTPKDSKHHCPSARHNEANRSAGIDGIDVGLPSGSWIGIGIAIVILIVAAFAGATWLIFCGCKSGKDPVEDVHNTERLLKGKGAVGVEIEIGIEFGVTYRNLEHGTKTEKEQ